MHLNKFLWIFLLIWSFIFASDFYGEKYLSSGNYYGALKHFQLAWRADPENPYLRQRVDLCMALINAEDSYNRGNYEQALKYYQQTDADYGQLDKLQKVVTIIELQRQYNFYYQVGAYTKAAECLAQICQINPADEKTRAMLKKAQYLAEVQDTYRKNLYSGNADKAARQLNYLWSVDPQTN